MRRYAGGWAWAAGAAVTGLGLWAWPYTVDDAYILARYATHLRTGHGYAMNPGGPVTDGITGPLWLVPMAAGIPAAKAAGLLCAAVAAVVATGTVQRIHGTAAAVTTAAFVGCASTLGIWGVAGLETGAATLAVTIVAMAAMGGQGVRLPILAPAAAVVPWLRPEAVPVVGAALAILCQRDGARGGRAAAWATAGILSVVLFRWWAFGSPLPLSAVAKPPDLGHGLAYTGRSLVAAVGPGALVLMLVALVARGARDRLGDGRVQAGSGDPSRTVRVCAALVAVHLTAVGVAGGDWMPGYRLVAPIVPVVGVAAGAGVARWARTRAHVAMALAGVVAVPLADAWVQLPEARQAGQLRQEVARPLAAWLGRRFDHVALVDAGYLPWAGAFRALDLAGITDPRVARSPGGHLDKRFDPGLLAAAEPDAILLHSSTPPVLDDRGRIDAMAGFSVEERVAAMPWVRAHYRAVRVVRYTPDYYYMVLARRDRESPARVATGRSGE